MTSAMPGKIAPTNRSPTEMFMMSASITSTILGGMIWPSVPDAAMVPVAMTGE